MFCNSLPTLQTQNLTKIKKENKKIYIIAVMKTKLRNRYKL